MSAFGFALSFVAMTLIALAMNRHHRQRFRHDVTAGRQYAFRLGGALLLTAAAAVNVWPVGLGIGLVTWIGQTMLAGVLVGLLLAWRERWLLPFGALLALAGLLSAAS